MTERPQTAVGSRIPRPCGALTGIPSPQRKKGILTMKRTHLRLLSLAAALLLAGGTLTACDDILFEEATSDPALTAPDGTPDTEEATEAETQPPARTEDFSDDSLLSLFGAEQGTLSVSEEGELVLEALWPEGAVNRSFLIFDPAKVMAAIEPRRTEYPGAIVIKAKRVKATPETPTVHVGNATLGRLADLDPLTAYRHTDPDSAYEYFVIDTSAASLTEGMTPLVYVEWVCAADKSYASDGRSLTVREISFHGDIWEAFHDVKQSLDEEGVAQPTPKYWIGMNQILFDTTPVRVPFFYLEPRGPEGELIDRITSPSFTDSAVMTVAVLGEGFDHLSDRCLGENENLQAVYLPDSLTKLTGDPFAFCPKLTHIRLGSGIQTIEDGAIPFGYVTDIDYNGTMAQWCQVDRDRGLGSGRVVVHCLDGDIAYAATEPDTVQAEAAARELAWSTPLALTEGQIPLSIEFTRLTLTDGDKTAREILLRWALIRPEEQPEGMGCRYLPYFDVLSPEDGSVLYTIDPAEQLAFSLGNGNGLMLSAGAAEEGMPKTATLILAGYGFGEDGASFRVQTTHFKLELDGNGRFTVNRDAEAKLNADVTVPFPMTGYGDLNKTRQIFRDMDGYVGKTHGYRNSSFSYLLLVNRPHGDGAIRNLRTAASPIDGFFFNAMWQTLDPATFNKDPLSTLYERYGALKDYQRKK